MHENNSTIYRLALTVVVWTKKKIFFHKLTLPLSQQHLELGFSPKNIKLYWRNFQTASACGFFFTCALFLLMLRVCFNIDRKKVSSAKEREREKVIYWKIFYFFWKANFFPLCICVFNFRLVPCTHLPFK